MHGPLLATEKTFWATIAKV